MTDDVPLPETFADQPLSFTIPARDVRGRIVRLDAALDQILSAHDYPPPIALLLAEALVLVFPTWWFGFPAVLKGWFDRVWTPGLAFDHSPGFGPMIPRLHGLQEVLAVTTMGAPAWIDWLVLRRPVRRVLRWAILKPCAPNARLTWRVLHSAEAVAEPRIAALEARLGADLTRMERRL